MSTKSQKPVIFLAFANDRVDGQQYLRNLPEEARRLRDALEIADQAGQCEVVIWQNATLSDVLDVFQRAEYRQRIAIFHFAGHANGYQLLLESAEGQPAIAHAEGLAHFLGQQPGLKLVFLNGCSTRQQVEGLLVAQIPAVIATSQAIDDEVAMEFASRLYKGIGSGAELGAAYQEAQAAIQVRWGSNPRGLYYITNETEATPPGWPWELYLQPAGEAAAQWGLPQAAELAQQKPRLPFEPETVLIPAGAFLMGNNEGEPQEAPQHTVELPDYWIGKYPVTNRQYAEFIRQTRQVVGSTLRWDGNLPSKNELDHPVTGITWMEALAYCRWLSAQTGQNYTLPSEAQWEKAARTTDGRRYPWGDTWDPNRCNHQPDEITPVTAYPAQNEYGCFDLVGNTREWTTTLWGTSRQAPDLEFNYPWQPDGRDSLGAPETLRRVYRGGRTDDPNNLRCSYRDGYLPDMPGPKRNRHGFRVVLLL